jgi:5-methyltetrahydrofolate--homocysteine methyltransferase
MSIFDEISELVQRGKANDIAPKVQEALDGGASAQQILDDGLLTGMGILGEKFKNGEVFVPEVLLAAKALNAGTAILKEKLVAEDVKPLGKVVIATVEGDLHDIGKNLVKLMMEGVGFEVIDLGADVSAEKIVTAAKENSVDIIALSALLTTTMGQMAAVVDALEKAGMRSQVKVMVGGSPITDNFCKEVGADAYAVDAASAAETAKNLVTPA